MILLLGARLKRRMNLGEDDVKTQTDYEILTEIVLAVSSPTTAGSFPLQQQEAVWSIH